MQKVSVAQADQPAGFTVGHDSMIWSSTYSMHGYSRSPRIPRPQLRMMKISRRFSRPKGILSAF
jgi:hypothetical protein